jgi:hypothetical protein
MSHPSWSPEEREEFEALCEEAWTSSDSTRARTEEFLRLLHDAEQGRRLFAKDTLREAEGIGAASILKRWNKRTNRVAVSYDGKVLSKPRTIGTTRADAAGNRYAVQTLFDYMTFEEIETKVREYLRQVSAYRENIYIGTRLLELRDMAPDARTPAEACKQIGTTVDAFLAADAA